MAKTPEYKRLITRCQSLWDGYCRNPTPANLRKVGAHLEKMKASSSKRVKNERSKCLRAYNAELRAENPAPGRRKPATKKRPRRNAKHNASRNPIRYSEFSAHGHTLKIGPTGQKSGGKEIFSIVWVIPPAKLGLPEQWPGQSDVGTTVRAKDDREALTHGRKWADDLWSKKPGLLSRFRPRRATPQEAAASVREQIEQQLATGAIEPGEPLVRAPRRPGFWEQVMEWSRSGESEEAAPAIPPPQVPAPSDPGSGGSTPNPCNPRRNASKRLPRKTIKAINEDLIAIGFDGNGRFKNMTQALSRLKGVLAKHGIEEAEVFSADRFRYDQGHTTFNIAFSNKADPFSPTDINNAVVTWQWHKHGPDRYEVVSYVG